MPAVLVYLIRHGETAENREHIIQGQLDTDLNELGRDQANRLATGLKDTTFHRAYSSDLKRAVDTARAVLEYHPETPLFEQHALRERHMGDLQGKKRQSRNNPPSVEPLEDLTARALTWWESSIIPFTRREASAGETPPPKIVVFSHGMLIATLLKALGSRRRYEMGDAGRARILNTGVTIVEAMSSKSGKLVQFCDVSHLEEQQANLVQTNVDAIDLKSGQTD